MSGRIVLFLTVGAIAMVFSCACIREEKSVKIEKTYDKTSQKSLPGKTWVLIDVRTPEEFASGHLKGALNIPGADLKLLKKKGIKGNTPLFLYCRSGRRVKIAIKKLKENGYTLLHDFGGMKNASEKLDLPIVK